MNRRIVLYIAMSLDGYIAKTGDDLSFLSIVEEKDQDYGYNHFIRQIDTVIIGRKTYDWIMKQVPEFVHADKHTYVITHTPRPAIGNTTFYTGNLTQLIAQLKQEQGKDIFIDGGATIVHQLLQEKLIDELIISIIPVLIGEGTKLFSDGRPEQLMELQQVQHFSKGLVQLHYKAKK